MAVELKKVLVIGATGGTGRSVVTQALDAGHTVTAIVRNPDKLALHHDRLRVLACDITGGGPTLPGAVRDQDAVISALGVSRSFTPNGLMQRAVPHILEAMRDHNVTRLIFTSAFGVGESMRDVPLLPKIFMRLMLKDIYADKAIGESLIMRSKLDWTIVQPVLLTDGPLTGAYRAAERVTLTGFPKISRSDTAHFLLAQVDDRSYIRKTVILHS
jgi:putative NADH-flavin reductase